jgi:hypothetical protein
LGWEYDTNTISTLWHYFGLRCTSPFEFVVLSRVGKSNLCVLAYSRVVRFGDGECEGCGVLWDCVF